MSTRVPGGSISVRKVPRQARSRATVEVILEAGARVLGAVGWTGFTTNKVAETAGVSIGSLYQYFLDKAALVATIREKHLSDCLAVLRTVAESDLVGRPLVSNLIEGLIGVHDTSPGLHRVLLEEVPEVRERLDPRDDYEIEYMGYYEMIVTRLFHATHPRQSKSIALIMSDAVDGVIHNAARRGDLRSPDLQAELVALVVGYLCDHEAE